jgi:hypothetical protein
MDAIKIGSSATYKLIQGVKGFGVWSKTLPNQQTWIIAKVPEAKNWAAKPSSILQEFASLAQATAAFERWLLDPLPPKALPKVKRQLGALRRNGNRPRPTKVNVNQLGLPL